MSLWPTSGPVRLALGAGALALAVAAGAVGVAARSGDDADPCPTASNLTVAVPPELEAVVVEVVDVLRRAEPCHEVSVTAGDVAEVARTAAARPDVWVPDSSVWAHEAGTSGPSLARTPVVLALPAGGTGARSGARPTVQELLAAADAPADLRLVVPDPDRSAAGLLAVGDLVAAGERQPLARVLLAQALRPDAPAGRPGRELRVTTEQALVSGGDGREAVYLGQPASALDYPYLVLTDDPQARDRAARLLSALQGDVAQEALRRAGFRDAAGAADPALLPTAAADAAPEVAAGGPDPDAVTATRRAVENLRRPARMLAVVDVSGSMARDVPGTDGQSRLDLARRAAAGGLALLPDDTVLGLWAFSTELTPTSDYRSVLPLAALTPQQRATAARAVSGLRVVPEGDTGLYDTTLAAVREVRRAWDPDRVNSVVVISDGRDEDADGIGLTELLATLQAEDDRRTPVPVVTIAYGPDSDVGALAAMSAVTDGTAYTAPDPRDVGSVFLDAVSQRTCRPLC